MGSAGAVIQATGRRRHVIKTKWPTANNGRPKYGTSPVFAAGQQRHGEHQPEGNHHENQWGRAMLIRDRIKEFRRVPGRELLDNGGNPRRHPQAQRDALRGVLEQVGVAAALICHPPRPRPLLPPAALYPLAATRPTDRALGDGPRPLGDHLMLPALETLTHPATDGDEQT
jgi:hypothetical protein